MEAVPETISGFLVAANERFEEGAMLSRLGRFGMAIYLLGYSGKMMLKAAAMRFDGALPASTVGPRLTSIRKWMEKNAPAVQPEGYHNIRYWAEYLRLRRGERGHRLSKHDEGLLLHHSNRIYSSWWISARYRADIAAETDFRRLFGDVYWLRTNYTRLWRI